MHEPELEDKLDHEPRRWPVEVHAKAHGLTTATPEPKLYVWRGLANPKARAIVASWRAA